MSSKPLGLELIAWHNTSLAHRRQAGHEGSISTAPIERAMNAFWSSGYHGTSHPDLLSLEEVPADAEVLFA
ncbi:hypothetical protein HDG35_006911 [Paraburkholderia sp. JPY681]|uniref:Uncharacterized protein n=1 Tax=Paraburkholderia atlantica TaxID=2654982 RepID=D5WP22_PARAM|nr:hypothetical protein [Paraburkholderia atlantica]ADG20645.1 hypothetical protein BC1002_6819 [Paraburkholderia atlantica]MBB5510614.1 hypothetical protein [Paraburkholderia atlantica]